jgi:hypothetical protein
MKIESHEVPEGIIEIYIGETDNNLCKTTQIKINGKTVPILYDSDFVLKISGKHPPEVYCNLYATRLINLGK